MTQSHSPLVIGPRIIVALDYASAQEALQMAQRLDPKRCRVKVGKELFTRAGPDVVRALQDQGFDVFLDLKFHDIPNTIAGACRAAAELGVWMVNVHASGGGSMMRAAREALGDGANAPLLIAVTVLTSLDKTDLAQVGLNTNPAAQVVRLAALAENAGLDGVVCSAADLQGLRATVAPGFLAVTPGVRPPGAAVGDQKRIATPALAIADGASYLVIGRPITAAPDTLAALQAIEAQLDCC
ncbi:MAG: orotidine-5'-phosphate decarboxylase [Gammaproteobacteria bacterium]|jgi:orotidine-5'-phosphate decarboxylase